MKPEHREKWGQFATWALKEYGEGVTGNTVWGRVLNTDFSAMIKQHGTLNSKNNIIWSKSQGRCRGQA